MTVETVDHHTAGEPFRIVAQPPVAIPGATVAQRRVNALADPDVDGLGHGTIASGVWAVDTVWSPRFPVASPTS